MDHERQDCHPTAARGRVARRVAVGLASLVAVLGVSPLGAPTRALAASGARPLVGLFEPRPYVVVIELPPPAAGRADRIATAARVAAPRYVVSQVVPEARPYVDAARSGAADVGTPSGRDLVVPSFHVGAEALTSAVPEPGTWAMLLIGFGVVGAAMRRRMSARTVAQAPSR